MCEQGNLTFVEELGPHGRLIDSCMVSRIRLLIKDGIETAGCCCGHGKYPMTIVFMCEGTGVYHEWFTSTPLLKEGPTYRRRGRTRRFYKTDEDGHYYIPETVEKKEE